MFIDINVSESANCPLSLNRVFDAMREPVQVVRLMASDPEGKPLVCNVTGWSTSGPCPAYAALVEDSGEGVAMLIYGGEEGIRLKAVDSQGDWDLNSSSQWGEACLLLDKDVQLSSF